MQHLNLDVLPYLLALIPFAVAAAVLKMLKSRVFEPVGAARGAGGPSLQRLYGIVSVAAYTSAAFVALYMVTGVHEALYAALLAGIIAAAPLVPFLTDAYAYIVLVRSGVVAPGERIEVDGVKGTVHSMGLFATVVRTEHGEYVTIPNRILAERIVTKRPMDRSVVDLVIRLRGVRGAGGVTRLEEAVARLRRLFAEFKAGIRGLESTLLLESVEGDSAVLRARVYLVNVSATVLSSLVSRIITSLAEYQPDVRVELRE